MGLPSALLYFMPATPGRQRGILIENLILLASIGLLFTVLLASWGNSLLANQFDNENLTRTILVFSPFAFFMLVTSSVTPCLVVRNKPVHIVIYNAATRLLILGSTIGACMVWRTPFSALAGMTVGAAVTVPPALFIMFHFVRDTGGTPSLIGLQKQVKYGISLGLAGMIGTLALHLDKVIVSSMCSRPDFAVYVNGAIEVPLVAVLSYSVTSVLLPEMSVLYRNGQYHEAIEMWQRAARKSALLLMPTMTFFLVMAPEVMTVLFSDTYRASSLPFRLYLLLLPQMIQLPSG